MNEKLDKVYNLILGVILISLGIFMILYSQKFPKFISLSKILPGPSFFPTIIGSLFIILGGYLVTESLIILSKLSKNEKATKNFNFSKIVNDATFQNFFIFIFLSIIYLIIINYIGFYISTFLYSFILMKRLKVKNITAIISSILIIFLIWAIFYKIAFIPLPIGSLFRR